MSEESMAPLDPFERYEVLLRAWLNEVDGCRVDAYCNAVHLVGENEYWLTSCRGEKSSVRPSREVRLALSDVRPSQVDPHRGAWLYSHFWMEAAEGVLHQEADWMREPVISASPIVGADAVVELEYYPRDPEWIPEWMAAKIAAYHEEEARGRQKVGTETVQEEGDCVD